MERSINRAIDSQSEKTGADQGEWDSASRSIDDLRGRKKVAQEAQNAIGWVLDNPKGQAKTVSEAISNEIAYWQDSPDYKTGSDYERQEVERDFIAPLTYLEEHLDEETLRTSLFDKPVIAPDSGASLYEAANMRFQEKNMVASERPEESISTPEVPNIPNTNNAVTETTSSEARYTERKEVAPYEERELGRGIDRLVKTIFPGDNEFGNSDLAQSLKGLGESLTNLSESRQDPKKISLLS